MYLIVMNDNKELIARRMPTIYQRESLVDKLYFIFPEEYNGISLIGATAVLKYTDAANVAHAEKLIEEFGMNKGHLTFGLPIDTTITKFAGDISVTITLTKVNLEDKKQYVLHTGEKIISVLPKKDLYAFIPDESLEVIDQMIGSIDAKIQAVEKLADEFDKMKADDLLYENNKLQLTSNGSPIGNSVDIIKEGSSGSGEFEIIEF